SLLDQFPSVKQSVLLEIARHEFEPSDLYKLDSKYRDKAGRGSLLELNGNRITLRDSTTKDYPTLHSLFPPLVTYFDILSAFAASSGSTAAVLQVSRGGLRYLSQLEAFHDEFQWSAVLSYHMEFHHERLREMARGDYSGWARIDASLQVKYLIGKERARVSST
ncbi:uncharacterized protein TRAVEDRAFT_77751, partial [Trametes versicolor FP-101664 SS1]|uniref:uncharacterized protein n=1 Tax=Trametes versicolor (strain FP-101664) TaxID=717944 RepID=UPI00046223EF